MCALKQVTNGCIFEKDLVEFLKNLTEEGVKKCILCFDEAVHMSKKHFEAIHMRYSVKITLHSKPGNCLFHYYQNSKVFFPLKKLNISLEVHPSSGVPKLRIATPSGVGTVNIWGRWGR